MVRVLSCHLAMVIHDYWLDTEGGRKGGDEREGRGGDEREGRGGVGIRVSMRYVWWGEERSGVEGMEECGAERLSE